MTATPAIPTRRTNSAGITLIKKWESCHLKAYICPSGYPTIGWGATTFFNNQPIKLGMKISQEQADRLLERDLRRFEADVLALVKVPLSDNQFAALVSFAYNCGSDIDNDSIPEGLGDSTLLRLLNRGNYAGAQAEFGKWVRGGGKVLQGLVSRRAEEARLFGS